MKGAVFEVVVTGLMLVLLISGFTVFQSSLDTVGSVVNKTNDLEKIAKEDLIEDAYTLDVSAGKNAVKGSDAISSIRYYASSTSTRVSLQVGGTTRTYCKDCSYKSYQASHFSVAPITIYEKDFCPKVATSGATKTITYTEKNGTCTL